MKCYEKNHFVEWKNKDVTSLFSHSTKWIFSWHFIQFPSFLYHTNSKSFSKIARFKANSNSTIFPAFAIKKVLNLAIKLLEWQH